MWKLTEKGFNRKLKKLQDINIQREYRLTLRKERLKCFNIKPIETHKLLAIYLFVLLNVIVVYSMIAMWQMRDLTYLGVLISDIAAQVIVYAIYCLKAYHGKKQEENLKYKRERIPNKVVDTLNDDAVG